MAPRYHIAILEDITPRKEEEQRREEFLSSAAHDLRTPLTNVTGYAQLARRRLRSSTDPAAAAATSYLLQIEDASVRQLKLIEELVDVTRADGGGGRDLIRRPTDVVRLVRTVVAQQEATATGPIIVEADAPRREALVDEARMERVVANLLANAVKYSPEGGAVTVRVAQVEDAVVISVSDQGMGIPATDLPHIFERFRRARNVVGRIPGTGVGLASARQIVALHGGVITVESTLGVGSTFTVRLPLAPPTVIAHAQS